MPNKPALPIFKLPAARELRLVPIRSVNGNSAPATVRLRWPRKAQRDPSTLRRDTNQIPS